MSESEPVCVCVCVCMCVTHQIRKDDITLGRLSSSSSTMTSSLNCIELSTSVVRLCDLLTFGSAVSQEQLGPMGSVRPPAGTCVQLSLMVVGWVDLQSHTAGTTQGLDGRHCRKRGGTLGGSAREGKMTLDYTKYKITLLCCSYH